MGLTAKQRRFIDEYFKLNMNATRAAIAVGYSEKTARQMGSENLSKPDISSEIERRLNESAMTADEVLARLAEQARGEYSAYMTPDGVDLESLLNDGKGHLIKKMKPLSLRIVNAEDDDIKFETAMEIEFYDAQSALVNLGKSHRLFTDKQEISGPDGNEIGQKITIEYVNDWRAE